MKHIRSPNLAPGNEGIMVMFTKTRRFARGGLVSEAHAVRSAGRFGDTMLVHLNPQEFAQLKRVWGEPHYNPDTELPEFFDWFSAIKTVAPYVVGALSSKASADRANQNLAPPSDANQSRPLANYTVGRTAIPQPHESPQSYYKYGQTGPETQFFKNNDLGHVTGPIPAPLTSPKQFSPSTGQSLLSGLGGGALQYAMQNPDQIAKLFGGKGSPPVGADGKPIDTSMGGPDTSGLYGGLSAGAPAAAAAWDFGPAVAHAGTITAAEMTPAEAYAAEMGALPEFGAGNLSALGGGSTLTAGSGAGAAGGAGAGGAGGAGAAGSGAATSGLGITPEVGGALGAAGIGAGITYAGLSTAPYRLTADWWKRLNTGLTQGTSGNATYDKNTPPDQQIYNSKMALYRMLQNPGGDTAVIGGAKGNNIPQAFRDMAKSYGMLNSDGSVNANWNPGEDPFVAAQRQKTGYVMYNGHWVPSGGVNVGGSGGSGGTKTLARGGLTRGYAMGGNVFGAQQPFAGALTRPVMPNGGMPPPNPANFGIGNRPPMITPPLGAPRPQVGIAPQSTLGMGPLSRSFARPMMGGAGMMGGRLYRASGGPVDGPGTGTSDDIPARLSAGEYIVPAHVVAALGDGSTSAGAKKLDRLQRNVRRITGAQMAAGRHPKPSKEALEYMGAK